MTKEEREEIKKRMQEAYEAAQKEAAEKRAKMTPEELEALKQASRHHAAKVRDEIITGYAIDQRKKLEEVERKFHSAEYQQMSIEEKYTLLRESLDIIENSLNAGIDVVGDRVIEIFRRIHALGYEIEQSKVIEYATNLHKPIVLKAVNIVRQYLNPYGDMALPLKDAMVYEDDNDKKKELEKEIQKIESQL